MLLCQSGSGNDCLSVFLRCTGLCQGGAGRLLWADAALLWADAAPLGPDLGYASSFISKGRVEPSVWEFLTIS